MRTKEVGGHTLPRIDFPSKRVHDAEMGRPFPNGLSRLNRMLKLSEGARQSKGIARQFRSGCVREVFPAPRHHHREHASDQRRQNDGDDPHDKQNASAPTPSFLAATRPDTAKPHRPGRSVGDDEHRPHERGNHRH